MIRAQSLAQVVNLADDPPLHRHASAPSGLQGLTLYIARVPGNRDVFLTTVKPLSKTVRAEDVNSCLYYVHVDNQRDGQLLRDEGRHIDQAKDGLMYEGVEVEIGVPAIRRKPLPSQPASARGDRPAAPINETSRSSRFKDSQAMDQVTTGKVLGPRPLSERPHSPHTTALRPRHDMENRNVRPESEQPFSTRKIESYSQKQQDLDDVYNANVFPYGHENRSFKNKDDQTPPQADYVRPISGSSLTLIRRYNGDQLNVARIEGEGSLKLLTSGYLKYCDQDNPNSQQYVQDCTDGEGNTFYFCRSLRPRIQKQRPGRGDRLVSVESSLDLLTAKRSFNDRRHNQQILAKGETARQDASRHYTFEDPWHSECEFITGIAGRSLKCRTSLAYLSELRFNLPSSQALRSPLPTSSGTPKESARPSFFARHQRISSSASGESTQVRDSALVPDDNGCRIDLSLGQESAGGGFGGKQAKLGKLIIEPKGMPMLDLLVAANMAMWWKIYDKMQ